MLTPEQQAFLAMAAPAAVQSEKATGLPAELTLSQAIFESGWGKRMPGLNCFGIKPDDHGTGVQYFISTEYLNGKWEQMPEAFEKYNTLADCFTDHSRLLTTGAPYVGAWAEYQQDHDLDAFIVAVAHRYATSPIYAQQMLAEAHSATVRDALAAARRQIEPTV
jgi:flagellum-specific peptidoglycan hydrolase FlgJ